MTALEEDLATVLDNYGDVIEGGNAYRGSGTKYFGVPGFHAHDELEGTAITAAAGGDTDTLIHDGAISDALAARLVRVDTPAMFVRCTSQAALAGNVGGARRIASYTASTNTFELAAAFTDSIAATDVFTTMVGFKRAPDNIDIERDEGQSELAFDRTFSLDAPAGVRAEWYGNGVQQFETTLTVQLRHMKHARSRRATEHALANIALMRSIITRGDQRDTVANGGSAHVQILEATGAAPEVVVDDELKVVVADRYRLVYRLNSTFV